MTIQSRALLAAGTAFVSLGISAAQDKGMIPSWEVREMTEDIVKNVATGQKVLAQLRPEEWLRDGASEAYVEQLETMRSDLENAALSARALGRNPERLSYAFDTFLWLERSDSLLNSVAGGVRKYYNGAIADLLDSARGRNVGNITKLKGYVRQLVVEIETSMEIAHNEAQRCRAAIASQPRRP